MDYPKLVNVNNGNTYELNRVKIGPLGSLTEDSGKVVWGYPRLVEERSIIFKTVRVQLVRNRD